MPDKPASGAATRGRAERRRSAAVQRRPVLDHAGSDRELRRRQRRRRRSSPPDTTVASAPTTSCRSSISRSSLRQGPATSSADRSRATPFGRASAACARTKRRRPVVVRPVRQPVGRHSSPTASGAVPFHLFSRSRPRPTRSAPTICTTSTTARVLNDYPKFGIVAGRRLPARSDSSTSGTDFVQSWPSTAPPMVAGDPATAIVLRHRRRCLSEPRRLAPGRPAAARPSGGAGSVGRTRASTLGNPDLDGSPAGRPHLQS